MLTEQIADDGRVIGGSLRAFSECAGHPMVLPFSGALGELPRQRGAFLEARSAAQSARSTESVCAASMLSAEYA
jgi:hypothetical protein